MLVRRYNIHYRKRNQARLGLEKDFYELLSNAFFSKTLENVRKRIKKEIAKKGEVEKFMRQLSKISFNGIHRSLQYMIVIPLNGLK